MKPLNFKRLEEELSHKLRRDATPDDVFSHIMYPSVFADYLKKEVAHGNLSVLPTPAFFYGMKPGEEISVDIEEGKTLFITLVSIGAADAEGKRVVTFELNGMSRQISVADRAVKPTAKARAKADPNKPREVGAPIPGLVTALSVSVGAKVSKGDKLATLEAMKMQTTIYAPLDGVVDQVAVQVGDAVDSKDLLMKLKEA